MSVKKLMSLLAVVAFTVCVVYVPVISAGGDPGNPDDDPPPEPVEEDSTWTCVKCCFMGITCSGCACS